MTVPQSSTGATPGGSAHTTPRTGRIRRPAAVAVDVVFLVVLIALLPETFDLRDSARRFPLVMIAVLVALLCLDIAMEVIPAVRRWMSFLETDYVPVDTAGSTAEEDEVPAAPAERQFRKLQVWQAVAWLVALGAGMYFFGYLLATPVFLVLFFLWTRVPIRIAVGITATLTALNYFVFFEYLGLR